ncbi:MAG: hypothetical protein O3C60_19430 [Planctomycetota bacterium]|nr:hypothetical protein [Planctomycetota bacterium]
MPKKSYRWPTEASEYSIWHPDATLPTDTPNLAPNHPATDWDVGWTTAGWLDRELRDASSSARWRVDPPVTGIGSANSQSTQPSLDQGKCRSVSGRVAVPQSSYHSIDPAHFSPSLQRVAAKSAPITGWWCFLLSIHLMLIGALWLIVDQWIVRQNAAAIQRALVYSLYAAGQLLALGCLGYLVLQLQRNWQKTQRVVGTLARQVNQLFEMRRQTIIPSASPSAEQGAGSRPLQVNAAEQPPSFEEVWRKTSNSAL